MARPRLPTNVHKIKGTGKVNPERMRARENEPKDDRELKASPDWMEADVKAAWDEITTNAIPGVLMQVDSTAVSLAAELLAKVRRGEAQAAEQNLLFKYLSQFGMTPADRSKISLPKKGDKNPFADD